MLDALAVADHVVRAWLTSYRAAWLDDLMLTATDIGARGFVWLVTATILFVFPARRAGAWRLLLTVGFTYLLVDGLLKTLMWRPRPFDVLPDAYLIAAKPTNSSFPSGHAASAVAGAMAASRALPEARALWIVLAALIALSRVYVGVHFPLDVAAGALVGALSALFVLGGRHPATYDLPALSGAGILLPSPPRPGSSVGRARD